MGSAIPGASVSLSLDIVLELQLEVPESIGSIIGLDVAVLGEWGPLEAPA